MNRDEKVVMMKAVGAALDYKKRNPEADIEKAMQHVMDSIEDWEDIKIAAIAAATKALGYLERTKMSYKEIMQKVMDEADEILESTEDQD